MAFVSHEAVAALLAVSEQACRHTGDIGHATQRLNAQAQQINAGARRVLLDVWTGRWSRAES